MKHVFRLETDDLLYLGYAVGAGMKCAKEDDNHAFVEGMDNLVEKIHAQVTSSSKQEELPIE